MKLPHEIAAIYAAIELPNGNLLIPARAEGPDGMIGDRVREIGPDDPEFQVWSDWLRSHHTDAEA